MPKSVTQFAAFAGAVAAHFKPKRLRKFEVWNEPNIGPGRADPVFYAELLKHSIKAIKASNEDAVVSFGAMAGHDDTGGHLWPGDFIDDTLSHLTSEEKAGIDAFALNAYSAPGTPDQKNWWNQIDQIEGPLVKPPPGIKPPKIVYDVMVKHGLGHIPILQTEFGEDTSNHTLEEQDITVREDMERTYKRARVTGRYCFKLTDSPGSFGDFGLLTEVVPAKDLNNKTIADKVEKTAARTYKTIAEKLKRKKAK